MGKSARILVDFHGCLTRVGQIAILISQHKAVLGVSWGQSVTVTALIVAAFRTTTYADLWWWPMANGMPKADGLHSEHRS